MVVKWACSQKKFQIFYFHFLLGLNVQCRVLLRDYKKKTQPSTLSFLLANILDSLCILKVFPTAIVFLVLEVGPRTLRRPLLCPIYRHALSTTALYLLTRYLPLRSIYPCRIYHHAQSSTVLYLPLCYINNFYFKCFETPPQQIASQVLNVHPSCLTFQTS